MRPDGRLDRPRSVHLDVGVVIGSARFTGPGCWRLSVAVPATRRWAHRPASHRSTGRVRAQTRVEISAGCAYERRDITAGGLRHVELDHDPMIGPRERNPNGSWQCARKRGFGSGCEPASAPPPVAASRAEPFRLPRHQYDLESALPASGTTRRCQSSASHHDWSQP